MLVFIFLNNKPVISNNINQKDDNYVVWLSDEVFFFFFAVNYIKSTNIILNNTTEKIKIKNCKLSINRISIN